MRIHSVKHIWRPILSMPSFVKKAMSTKSNSGLRASQQEKMFALIQRFERSGLTQSKFWQTHEVSRSTFHYWLRKYRRTQVDGQPGPAGFIGIKVRRDSKSGNLPSCSSPSFLELTYPDGSRLRFESSVAAEYIRHFIPGLENS